MLKKLNKQKEGFTIIEVLIVLAIAGLIMLIVFLAVPALQRNSRNTRRRNDVATYLGAINEFISNNNGALPSTAAHITTVNGLANSGFLTEPVAAPSAPPQSGAIGVDTFQVVTGAKCDTVTIGNAVAGSSRQFVLRFAVEDSSGAAVPQCSDS